MKARGVKSHQWMENQGGDCVYMCVWGGVGMNACHMSSSIVLFFNFWDSLSLTVSIIVLYWYTGWPLWPRIFESLVLCIEIIRASCQTWYFLWVLLSELGSLCLHDKDFPAMISLWEGEIDDELLSISSQPACSFKKRYHCGSWQPPLDQN